MIFHKLGRRSFSGNNTAAGATLRGRPVSPYLILKLHQRIRRFYKIQNRFQNIQMVS